MIETSVERIPCQFCGRKFASEPLSKHTKVCEKTSSKKRKTFNSAQQRIQGTELAEFTPVLPATPPPVKKTETVPSKTARSRSVRVVTITNKSNPDVPPPHPRSTSKLTSPSAKSSNNEKCQYCDRCFGPKSFDRHIEWCKEQSSRINATTAATREALERLEARTKVYTLKIFLIPPPQIAWFHPTCKFNCSNWRSIKHHLNREGPSISYPKLVWIR